MSQLCVLAGLLAGCGHPIQHQRHIQPQIDGDVAPMMSVSSRLPLSSESSPAMAIAPPIAPILKSAPYLKSVEWSDVTGLESADFGPRSPQIRVLKPQMPLPSLPHPQLPGPHPAPQPSTPETIRLTRRAVSPPTARPYTNSQLYHQRVAAIRAGRTYTRLPPDSFRADWLNATQQPNYQQWINLLGHEAEAMARGQGHNPLTVLVGDSLSMWFPSDRLSSQGFVLNQGISGDTTTGVLQRLNRFSQTRPHRIHVMVGINDLRQGASDQTVLINLHQIMRQLKQTHPQAQIVVHSILPTRLVTIPVRRIQSLNAQLSTITQHEGLQYLNLQVYFADESGQLRQELTTDGLHLNLHGYSVWQSVWQQFSLV